MKISSLMIRMFVYIGMVIVLLAIVFVKQRVITQKRLKQMPSIIREWYEVGKSVKVKKIILENVSDVVKITLEGDGLSFKGYVPRAVWKKIKEQQDVFTIKEQTYFGKVMRVGQEVDVETGLYEILVQAKEKKEAEKVIVNVVVGSFKDAIVVPSESIVLNGDSFYVWVIQQDRAYQKNIKPIAEGSFGVIVENDLHIGDLLVVEGHTMLRQEDRVVLDEGGLI